MTRRIFTETPKGKWLSPSLKRLKPEDINFGDVFEVVSYGRDTESGKCRTFIEFRRIRHGNK